MFHHNVDASVPCKSPLQASIALLNKTMTVHRKKEKKHVDNDAEDRFRFVFLKGKAVVPFYRTQEDGTTKCSFLHAPAVLHGYLMQLAGTKKLAMVDISYYMRDHVSNERIFEYVLMGSGSSVGTLKDLIEQTYDKKSDFPPLWATVSKEDLESHIIDEYGARPIKLLLKGFGFGLVSCFKVDRKFVAHCDCEVGTLLDGTVDESEIVGTHAMVLVRVRKSKNGEWRMLLQNCWDRMLYVDMTLEYFVSAQPTLTFVTVHKFRDTISLPLVTSPYAIASFDGLDIQHEKK